ncbi:MAG: hypothetical protein Q4A06_05045 [Cardiobacteriaceae bacterium]|nr:hypothetical protein [Cardiobacteriaceae bacterium]
MKTEAVGWGEALPNPNAFVICTGVRLRLTSPALFVSSVFREMSPESLALQQVNASVWSKVGIFSHQQALFVKKFLIISAF